MRELTYPQDSTEEELYESVRDVLNHRGYKDLNGETDALYKSNEVTVELEEELLKIQGPSSSEEEIIANLLEPELE